MRKPGINGFLHMMVGYMRVSSNGDRNNTARQRDASPTAGVDDRHLYEDKAGGARASRPGLEKAFASARAEGGGLEIDGSPGLFFGEPGRQMNIAGWARRGAMQKRLGLRPT